MIIKLRNKSFLTSHKKHISTPKNNLEHTCTHKSLLSIYIIYNYIIYRSVSHILHFRNFTYLYIRVRFCFRYLYIRVCFVLVSLINLRSCSLFVVLLDSNLKSCLPFSSPINIITWFYPFWRKE